MKKITVYIPDDKMEEFDFIEFGIEDIVRSNLVKSYIIARHKLGMD